MKSILISIRPKWCEKIFSGEKTVEVRKTMPKQLEYQDYYGAYKYNPPIKVYMYMSGAGHVVGYFECDRIELFDSAYSEWAYSVAPAGSGMPMSEDMALNLMRTKACLSDKEITAYLGEVEYKAYFWSVNNPTKYAEPKPLSDFGLTRAPQSWQYVGEG